MKILVDVEVVPAALAALQKSGKHEFDLVPQGEEEAKTFDPARLRDVDVLFAPLPPVNFTDMHRLKWIQLASVGYSQLFGLDLKGAKVTNARGCFDVPIAEWNIAMMVNLARDLRLMIRNQDAAIWDRSAVFQREIRGHVVGIWGYGGIGRETARLARHLGLKVKVMTRSGVQPRTGVYTIPGTGDPEGVLPDETFRAGQEIAFLEDLDFLVVATPLTNATEGLIGERELRALPPKAVVLNPARGPIIQEQALLRALREKWIAGAALDTHYHYPMPPDHPLWKFPNVIFTPHISGSSQSPNYPRQLWEIFTLNLARLERGEPLLNELTPAQLAGA